ncbi:MAG: SDR family oxidoreductase [Treponema sp.]|nr:SDR family oxidoreductase [Treponema sp.]
MDKNGEHLCREGVFAGKRALVIGGSGGIGKAVAMGLVLRGVSVIITGGNSEERLEKTLAELNTMPIQKLTPITPGQEKRKHSGFLCKIGSPEGFSPEKAASFILDKAGMTDILVISWGPFKKIALQDSKPEDWRSLVENNLIFPGIMISLVINDMKNRGWGRILLFGGTKTADIRGFSDTVAYSTAKTALGTLAKSAAKSAGNAGVSCNVLCPGLTATEYSSPEDLAYYRTNNPGGKTMTAEEMADCALGILESSVINGAIIPADGGLWV